VVPAWTVAGDGALALDLVLRDGFDPAVSAVVEADPEISSVAGTPPGSASYTEASPEDVRIDAVANGPSLVVVRNSWAPGWHATVDGRPTPMVRADFFLQAVPVLAGEHVVRLVYREPAIGAGLLASAVVWLGFAGVLAGAVALARRRTTPGPAPPRDA
jgi:hypothetical protein